MIEDWHSWVIYQVYPRSFLDTNGDGIGDIQGILEKLDYFKKLGVDALWLSPLFKSPMKDNGYDISDYRSVDPVFGTNEEMDELLNEAKKRNLHILLDLVVNHTSSEHYWFKEALKGPENPYHDYYVWRKNPLQIQSVFSGSAWEYVPSLGEYYLHLFAKEQPDLNWANPRLREEVYGLMEYWLKKGVSGFRMDVIEYIGKDPDTGVIANGPHLHDYLQEMSRRVLQKYHAVTVGECWSADNESRLLYTDPARGELSMVFQFDQWTQFWDPHYGKWERKAFSMPLYRQKIFAQMTGDSKRSWPTCFWDNHDLTRALSYVAEARERKTAAKMLFGLSAFSRGTPFIYQGDELGQVDAGFSSLSELEDIESQRAYQELLSQGLDPQRASKDVLSVSRDNARLPFPWNESPKGGFSSSVPWLQRPSPETGWSLEAEEKDPDSVFSFYHQILSFRKEPWKELLSEGAFQPLFENDPQLWVFQRAKGNQHLTIIANFSAQPANNPFSNRKPLLKSGDLKGKTLGPYAFAVYED